MNGATMIWPPALRIVGRWALLYLFLTPHRGSIMPDHHYVAVCAMLISLLAFCLSIVTTVRGYRQKKIDNLVTLHQFLHQSELSEARRCLREGDCQLMLKDPSVRKVCSSFDFAGSLVRNDAVNADMFLQYWKIPLGALEKPLSLLSHEITGNNILVRDYYKDFWWLLERARTYKSPNEEP